MPRKGSWAEQTSGKWVGPQPVHAPDNDDIRGFIPDKRIAPMSYLRIPKDRWEEIFGKKIKASCIENNS
jgi:hypothetical protein